MQKDGIVYNIVYDIVYVCLCVCVCMYVYVAMSIQNRLIHLLRQSTNIKCTVSKFIQAIMMLLIESEGRLVLLLYSMT